MLSVAKAIVGHKQQQELLFALLVDKIDAEYITLCRHNAVSRSLFCKIPVSNYCDFNWKTCIDELAMKAPRLNNLYFVQVRGKAQIG